MAVKGLLNVPGQIATRALISQQIEQEAQAPRLEQLCGQCFRLMKWSFYVPKTMGGYANFLTEVIHF